MEAFNFDDLDVQGSSTENDKPLWMIDLDNKAKEGEVLAWLNNDFSYLLSLNRNRFAKVRKNMLLYKGVQYYTQQKRDVDRETGRSKYKQVQKIVINHLYDLVQQRIARLLEYKPGVTFNATNTDYSDTISAQMMDMFIEHLWYMNKYEADQVPDLVTWAKIMGESFLFQLWNPDMGAEHPDWKNRKEGEQIPLLDDNGQQLKDDKGNPRWIEKPVHVGDIEYEPEVTLNVLLQRKPLWKKIDYCYRMRWMHVEEARLLFEGKCDTKLIQADNQTQIYDYETHEMRASKNEVCVKEMFYRQSLGIGKGRYLAFTKDVLCDNQDYFEKTGLKKELPCERLVDIKLPMETHATSFIDHIKGPLGAYNNVTNMILRNQYLVSHPKWMLPAGSAELEELGNDITIVQFRGPVAPSLAQANPTPAELFNFRKELKGDAEQVGGVFGVSRGNPPPGIDAGIALQFLEEQENKRDSPDYVVFNEFNRRVALKSQMIAGSKYEASDKRTIGILGKYDQWMSCMLNISDFEKDYDVRASNASALPRSKTARIQTLVYLQKNYPNAIPAEQVIDMMELGQSKRFTDAATVAVRAAEMENDDMLAARKVREPEEFENHIQHWKIHSRVPQEYMFKGLPEEIQQSFKDHIMATEMLMWEKAKTNPLFLQQLAALPNYPMFFAPDMPVPNTNTEAGPVAGDASTASEPIAPDAQASVVNGEQAEPGEVVRPTRLVGQNAPPLATGVAGTPQ